MLYPGDIKELRLAGAEYRFYAKGKIISNTDSNQLSPFSAIKDYELRVRSRSNEKISDQLIFKADIEPWIDYGYLGGVTIIWAGDLNNDKHLDIIFDHLYHHEGGTMYLYMASEKSKGILKEVIKSDYGY